MKRILSFGEIIWDVYPEKQTIGGAALNFAAHLAQMGAESYLYSAVGEDPLGSAARETLSEMGVRSDFVFSVLLPTGQCLVTLKENGLPQYRVLPSVAYDAVPFSPETGKQLSSMSFDAVYFGTLIQRETVSRESLRRLLADWRPAVTVCDVNLRENCYDADSVSFCLESATVLKVSREEEPLLQELGFYRETGCPRDRVRALARLCPRLEHLILTMGEEGVLSYSVREDRFFFTPAVPAEVVSTVGAGDSFLAAWVLRYLEGADPETCNGAAVRLASYVVSCVEAVPPIPSCL